MVVNEGIQNRLAMSFQQKIYCRRSWGKLFESILNFSHLHDRVMIMGLKTNYFDKRNVCRQQLDKDFKTNFTPSNLGMN